MSRRSLFFTGLTMLSLVLTCAAAPQPPLTRHIRDAVMSGQAELLQRLPASQVMNVDVVLPLRHEPELDNFLQELYDPSSQAYRHYVSVEEFTERFGPSQEDYEAVLRFAQTNSLTVIGGSRDAMDVQLTGSVSAIEKAFHVNMGLYRHPFENRNFYSPDREPTTDLPFQLWHVSGLENYSLPRPLLAHRDSAVQQQAVKGSCPGGSYCGSDMRAAYYGQTTLTGSGQNVGLLEFAGYDIADFNTYFHNVHQTNKVPIHGVSADGSSLQCLASGLCDDREQVLDMVQAVSMAPGLSGLYIFVSTSSDTAMLSSMSTHKPLCTQLSSSWTWSPADPSTDDPYFKKFAAQGQNYFQAAGDSGAYNSQSTFVYPADDAYVTSVGGTDLQTSSAGGPWESETAWSAGGGGYFTPDAIPIPSWQKLSGVINTKNKGSNTLRNSPDVAAEANYDFYTCADQEACQTGWGGTSFAAPMWAGYMALVNQQALENGNPVLGFINPIIYPLGLGSGAGSAFHDITSGNNGYPAVAKYDLATGWGSPHGAGLISALAGTSGKPAVSLSPTSLSWPKVAVGEATGPLTVTLTNTGTGTLNISKISVSGDFFLRTVPQSCKSTVAAGANCVLKVSFKPTKTGTRTGKVTIADDAAGSPQQVSLSGTGR